MTTTVMDIVTTEAPTPAGHYVQARAHQGVLYISGQLPLRADGSRDPSAPLEVQIRQALHNLLAIVRAGGSAPEHLLKITSTSWGWRTGHYSMLSLPKSWGPAARPAR